METYLCISSSKVLFAPRVKHCYYYYYYYCYYYYHYYQYY